MRDKLLHIYDWFAGHPRWLWGIGALILIPLIVLAATLRYNEDIMDFLPATPEERENFRRLQSQQQASRIYLIIEGDSLREEALYACADSIPGLQYDMSDLLAQFYARLPYLITDSTYHHLDSLFTPQAIRSALLRDKRLLSAPGASAILPAIRHDPLALAPLHLFQQQSARRTIAYIDTPYGATETRSNAELVDSLNAITASIMTHYPSLDLRWTGAPVIAVGNARRIKTDTMVCIAFSLVMIIALLAYAFPRKRDLWLILLAVSFGWLTGMAALRIVTPAISAIVLGIGSVLIGISVNYPLHVLVHRRYTASVRQTLEEVLSPLITGNITTVGAFLALVPLQATAMRHLGIFAAAMLAGTIIFCIFFLPHLMSDEPVPVREIKCLRHVPAWHTRYIAWAIIGITFVLGVGLWLNPTERFDANLNHINYMSPGQRADMASLESVKGDAAKWNAYWQSHDPRAVVELIKTEAVAVGFKPEAFAPFYDILMNTAPADHFDVSNLAKRLSDDFDYIGLCCSIIVFLFLWLSFKSFWLAVIAFVPMVLSWVWIFSFMQLFDIQFNIVNVILATFIFGQGDDYTIFVVEGLVYEDRTGKPILPQYRQSILLSALIMLIGIGILAFAVHPAMHSLGVVTLIGMTVVLMMSITIPGMMYAFFRKIGLLKQ